MKSRTRLILPALALGLSVCCRSTMASGADAAPARAIGAHRIRGAHNVFPRPEKVEAWLRVSGEIPAGASAGQVRSAVQRFNRRLQADGDGWISREVRDRALAREKEFARETRAAKAASKSIPVSCAIFALAVDFGGSDTYGYRLADNTLAYTNTSGPLKGLIPKPGPNDNATIWYEPAQTADAAFYERLIFGYLGVGRIRMDLTDPYDGLPGINLEGYTVQDYYDHAAGSNSVALSGSVQGWVRVDHSEGYYGADNYYTGAHYGGAEVNGTNIPAAQLVEDALAKFMAEHPGYYNETGTNAFWKKYDGNEDGIVDTCWIIHAGTGQESGGGAQGDFAIWSHSSDMRNNERWPAGFKVYEGDPATTNDDIYAAPYTMQPENLDLGVLTEEFAHNFFGLPDLYTVDLENSIGFWSHLAGGSWTGPLPGSVPVSLCLWLKIMAQTSDGTFVNWHAPTYARDYADPDEDVEVGQLEDTPDDLVKGVRVSLPDTVRSITNPVGAGKAAYSGTGMNEADIVLQRSLDIGPDAAGVFSFDFWCDIEEDWDYGYFMVNGTNIPDATLFLTNGNPNGNNLGWGLTGKKNGTMAFDLSAYKGQTVTLAFRYVTDAYVTGAGWFLNNLVLDGVTNETFETAEAPSTFPDGWTNSSPGWGIAPQAIAYPNYYLVEWRADSKYDRMLRTAHVYSQIDDNGGRIEMTPCNIPGALVYYRDSRYATSYELYGDKWSDAPSYGPKHQLLVADMNYRAPYLAAAGEFATTRLPDRAGSFDAALTLQPSETFNLPGLAGITNGGNWIFLPRPAITNFNDAKGYYAGWYLTDPMDGFIYWNNIAGSCVIPAGNSYSQRITHFDGSTHPAWYGIPFRGSLLGSGNPGAANAQHGVDITLLSKSPSGDRATLRFRGGVPAAAERRLTVTVTGGTAGTIRSSDGLISAGPGTNEASASYPGGSNVTLIAEAGMGSAFVGWSAADFHGTGTQVTFEIFADTPVQAVFAEPPAAVDDRYRVAFNRAREVADAHNGVLANDVTAAPWLFAELAGGPEHGTLSLNADGSFAYSPEPGFIGADTFTYRAVDAYKLESAAPATVTLLVGPQANDYDGDGASDLAVFDPGTGRWYIRTLAGAVPAWHEPWGWPGATPVPGDYNGDGRADLAIYDTDAGLWYIRSLGGKAIAWGVRWGGPGIVPAAGDYNGDGAFDLGLYWPERGAWYAVSLAEPAWHAWDERGAWPSLARAAGDFNADGASDLCEYDAQRGKWYARSIREAGISEWITWEFSWGGPALAPVAGDFDGDGASDTAVVDLEHGLWYIVTLDMRVLAWAHPWGAAGMIPVAGDFNGDGLSDLAMYAEPGGKWYIESMADGAILAWGEPWGFPGAIPMNAVR